MNARDKKKIANLRAVIRDLDRNWNTDCKEIVKGCMSCEAKRSIAFLKENIDMIRYG